MSFLCKTNRFYDTGVLFCTKNKLDILIFKVYKEMYYIPRNEKDIHENSVNEFN